MKDAKNSSPTDLLTKRRKKRKSNARPASFKKAHQMPGALVYTGKQHMDNMMLNVVRYDANHFEEKSIDITEIDQYVEDKQTVWLKVIGLHETDKIRTIGDTFGIHNLALEAILHVDQRPIFNDYGDQYFISTKTIRTVDEKIDTEQFSMIVGKGYMITFQEKEGDIFEGVKGRLSAMKGKIRSRSSDYLSFALLDVIIDHYITIIDEFGSDIVDQEIKIMEEFDAEMITDINLSKKEVNYLRKHIRPLQDTVLNFVKSEHHLIDDSTKPFLNGLIDHMRYVSDAIELYRDTINNNFNTYNTFMNNKLNDVLKVLTIFSVIFIPLTFLAGIYGMNFTNMPELDNPSGYPVLLVVMFVMALAMVIYFKRKKWL